MSKKIVSIGVIALVGVLIVFGLGSGGGSSGIGHSSGSQASRGKALSSEHQAPDVSLPRLGGGTISLAQYRGAKPVIVDFFATWCPNCRRDMPNENRYYEQYKQKIEVIGINLQENESAVHDFISARNVSFPIALDPSGQASQAFAVQYTNTHVLIDKQGNIVRTVPGDISESDFQSLL